MSGGRLLASAHDCAEGGIAVALAECAIRDPAHPFGLDVELDDDIHGAPLLFGEAQGRVVVSCAPEQLEQVLEVAARHGVPARRIGTVGDEGGRFVLRTRTAPTIDASAADLAEVWTTAIPRMMERSPAAVEVAVEHPAMPR